MSRLAPLPTDLELAIREAAWQGRDLAHATRGPSTWDRSLASTWLYENGGERFAWLANRHRWDTRTKELAWDAYETAFLDRMSD